MLESYPPPARLQTPSSPCRWTFPSESPTLKGGVNLLPPRSGLTLKSDIEYLVSRQGCPYHHAACQMITTIPMNNKTAPAVFCQVISSSPLSQTRASSRENSGAVYTMGAMIDTSP